MEAPPGDNVLTFGNIITGSAFILSSVHPVAHTMHGILGAGRYDSDGV